MSSSTTNNTNKNMNDVDRLFACFKCGLSPPPSALIERKRRKRKLEKEKLKNELESESPNPGSIGGGEKTPLSCIKTTNVESSIEKLKSAIAKTKSCSSRKQISPVVFYGSPHGVPPKKPTSLWRLLHEIRVDLSQRNKQNLRKEVWFTFPRQDEAVKFAKEQEDVHLFSYQDHFNGQRRFLVSTYTEFWRRYKNMPSKFRHHYEVIQEGLPCHLYFDLEFNTRVNIGKNGDDMVDLLISVVLEALHEKYEIHGERDWIVELDSSTEDKFSRHLILRIPKAAFKDNSHAGAFVSEVCSRILNAKGEDKSYEKLFVAKDDNESACQLFVDTAVYTRNRCFRLHLSSKAGKSSILLPTERFKSKHLSEEDMFMASLICNMDVDCGKLMVCKPDLDCAKTLHFDTELNYNLGNSVQIHPELTFNTCTSEDSRTYFMGKSPFPFVDEFILSVASVGNIPGKIHSWYLFSEFGLLIYSMTKNRYCERIGRQHKSNNVMFVVDLKRVMYYQKCYDPDCRGFRSSSRPIPIHLFSNPSVVGSSGMSNDIQPVDDKWGHQPDDNSKSNFLQYEDTVEGNSSDSWWLEAIKVLEDVESQQNATELSPKQEYDGDDEWWLAVERTASQIELTYNSTNSEC
ncbi:unnamed protein product [Vicia faba]|uniref:DNA-directed primase/polymerase protein n=1 Tax=Vicia faba TaxID=3906 RepID=A0AAV0Z8C9_VICFA|nr:unnamed protein product [Vicia faba]